MIDTVNASATGIVKITDAQTGEILHEFNAVHFGNLSASIAKALAGDPNGHIQYMVFGNGGTSITPSGTIFYRTPNVSVVRDDTASLYNQTHLEDITLDTDENNTTVILTNANYADLKFKATLEFGEPATQDPLDNAEDNTGEFVFDEIGLKTTEGILLTHILFHPVQKSLNRMIEVEYTLRIQMG